LKLFKIKDRYFLLSIKNPFFLKSCFFSLYIKIKTTMSKYYEDSIVERMYLKELTNRLRDTF